MLRTATVLLLLVTLIAGCERSAISPNVLPPLLGFGPEGGTVTVTGDTLRVPVLWTTATTEDRRIAYFLSGPGGSPEDVQLLSPAPLPVAAGATETDILLMVAPGFDSTRLTREGRIVLEAAPWFRLTERDTFTFGFGVPHTVALARWAPPTAFPRLYGYTSFGPEPVPEGAGPAAGEHFGLAFASNREPNVLGFYNPQGLSTNALNLHRVYSDFEVSSGSAGIRISNLFRLTPAAEGARRGTVEVIEQRVTIRRRASSGLPPFSVGISGGGTYDEDLGVIEVDVVFDETELGNGPAVLRRYVYESQRRQ